jgi:hypothetical protein
MRLRTGRGQRPCLGVREAGHPARCVLPYGLAAEHLRDCRDAYHCAAARNEPQGWPGASPCSVAELTPDPAPPQTELCPRWVNGICGYGLSCQFAHGEHELRQRPRPASYKTDWCKNILKVSAPLGAHTVPRAARDL